MRRALVLVLPAIALVAAACASSGGSQGRSGSRDLITRDQIVAADAENVYALVQRLQPTWLRKRGTNSITNDGDIVVYLDNARLGGPETLREIQPTRVSSVRFYDARAAQYRFGSGHTHGVIQVVTRQD